MDVTEEIVKSLVKATVDILKNSVSSFLNADNDPPEDIHERLFHHITEVANWSAHIQFLDMAEPKLTDTATVMLHMHTVPRRLSSLSGESADETLFLTRPAHYVLLGDPGSGKTTTLKRVVRRFIDEPISDNDVLQYPIVLFLRDYDSRLGLLKSIAQAIGITYQDVHETDPITGHIISSRTIIGSKLISEALPAVLDASKAFVVLDGLDEVQSGTYKSLVKALNQLARSLYVAKIVVSCRSGDYVQTLEGFRTVELSALTDTQIQAIADLWLTDSEPFLAQLSTLPYQDMVSRPLLLAELLCIFAYEQQLPDRPHMIYRKIVTLLLREWDRSRGIRRKTMYARFDPDTKVDFLSALAYDLTYKVKTKRFSVEQLVDSYSRLSYRYNLPANEAEEVAREIESHSGLIAAAGKFGYEFSHLSIQEYLCGYYIVREPRAAQLGEYIREYPAPLAIAVALASEPSTWFSDFILRYGNTTYFTDRSLQVFLTRLYLEKPGFVSSATLGYAVLQLYFSFYEHEGTKETSVRNALADLSSLNHVAQSIALALNGYWIVKDTSVAGQYFEIVWQHKVKDITPGSKYGLPPPSKGRLPEHLLLQTAGRYGSRLFWCNPARMTGRYFSVNENGYSYE